MPSARTDILWPTLLRSHGCSTLQWKKTLSLAALSVNRGENRFFFFCGAGWSRSTEGLYCSRYKAVIDACSLQPDIDLLPFGDQTEIGERVCSSALALYSFLLCTICNALLEVWLPLLCCCDSGYQPERRSEAENLCGPSSLPEHQHRLLGERDRIRHQAERVKPPQWWWQSKYFPYYSITS